MEGVVKEVVLRRDSFVSNNKSELVGRSVEELLPICGLTDEEFLFGRSAEEPRKKS